MDTGSSSIRCLRSVFKKYVFNRQQLHLPSSEMREYGKFHRNYENSCFRNGCQSLAVILDMYIQYIYFVYYVL